MTTEPIDGTRPDLVEVRVLGSLKVRRADGTLVDPRGWRTGATADLMRLLALHVDEPVPVDVLVDRLWPGVDPQRGRASLRTAVSWLRKVVGPDCLERGLAGIRLRDAWVDAHAFRMLAREARRHVVTGNAAAVVTTTREAEALYLDELRWHTGSASWALAERDTLAAAHRQLIADAADAALSLGWWHDAVDLAARSVAADPCSERAYRALMRAHQGLGETSRALQAYEQCRQRLAEEVGADPSEETRALHLHVLTEPEVVHPEPAFCGRTHEVAWLRDVADDAVPRPRTRRGVPRRGAAAPARAACSPRRGRGPGRPCATWPHRRPPTSRPGPGRRA